MSGRRGFLTKNQTKTVEDARRVLKDSGYNSKETYRSCLSKFVSDVYGCVGVIPPKTYVFSSPLACMLGMPHITKLHSDDNPLYLLTDLQNAFCSTLPFPSVLDGVVDKDRAMTSMVTQALNSSRKEQVPENFKEAFIREMKEQCEGTTEEFTDLLGRNLSSNSFLHGKDWWSNTATGGTWIWPYNAFVAACLKPVRADFDDRGRPHREDDAAIEFADGFRVWSWHGVLVPKEVILFPEALGFNNVEKETNLEVRRIMIERIGPGKYLKQAGAVLEDMDTLTLDGSAPRALMKDKLGNKWLVGTDGSTARVYTMAVPPDVKTCKEAHELIAGFEESRLIAEA